jgi:AraC-like DNA-binding protein
VTPGNHGILNPRGGQGHFALSRAAPPADLAAFVERTWSVRWDLRGRPPHDQETLPWPCANLVIGTYRPGLFGVCRTRFVAHLEGEGWVVGVKFRPGGFRPFIGFSMAELTDRDVPIGELFGAAGAELERAVHAAEPAGRVSLVEAFLRTVSPPIDEDAAEAGRIVDLARADRSIARVDDLAARASIPVRPLQRLFHDYVGVSPKWVIRRFRIQEAAERLATSGDMDAVALAGDLGYCDQAHFIRDFKAQVGRTPGAYAAVCAAAAAR